MRFRHVQLARNAAGSSQPQPPLGLDLHLQMSTRHNQALRTSCLEQCHHGLHGSQKEALISRRLIESSSR